MKEICEKYYWETADGTLIPKHKLDNEHVCNIVMRFGKENLRLSGHATIVKRFEELNEIYHFFKVAKEW